MRLTLFNGGGSNRFPTEEEGGHNNPSPTTNKEGELPTRNSLLFYRQGSSKGKVFTTKIS
jgi:hypothetical protein